MDREGVLKILRAHEPELKAAGVVHLRLFGSVARNEAMPESDVDVMVDIDRSKVRTLLNLSALQRRLADILGAEVELALRERLKEGIRARAMEEAILAF